MRARGILAFLLFSIPVPGQSSPPALQTWRRLPKFVLQDQKAIWTSPFHAGEAEASWWGILGAAGAALIATDKHTARQLPNTEDQVAVATWSSRIGAIYTLAPLDAGLYLLGAAKHDGDLREASFLCAEAMIDAAIAGNAVKVATQRERPTEGSGEGRFWRGSGRIWNAGSSFPSGHAIESWAFASVIARKYPRPVIVPAVAYGLAAIVSASRFAARRHFASDVVIGGVMGWFIGDYVYGKRHHRAGKQSALRKALARVNFGFRLQ
ncbi:MAG: phosphatase PAP2 family protein [Bryobacteraceae bacterium]